MSNNKQSSVEWYINNLIDILGDEICNKLTIEQTNRIHFLGKQAVAMHKQENLQTWLHCLTENDPITFEDYYNETFGDNNNPISVE